MLGVNQTFRISTSVQPKVNCQCISDLHKRYVKDVVTKTNEKLKLELNLIFDYYTKEIRPLAEQGVIVWNSWLTKAQVSDLEKIQKVALLIILGDKYSSYDVACKIFDISTLSSRRAPLCSSFAVKLFKGPRSEQFITLANQCVNARNEKKLINENIC